MSQTEKYEKNTNKIQNKYDYKLGIQKKYDSEIQTTLQHV